MTADSEHPAWVTDELLVEVEDDFLAELVERLIAGGRGTGLALEANECRVLAELVVNRPKRKRAVGRPRRDLSLLFYCIHCQCNGASTKAAVAATAERFGVSRSAVYAALKSVESK